MLRDRLQEFIDAMSSQKETLTDYDTGFLERLENNFQAIFATPSGLELLANVFAERSACVFDTVNDYTITIDGVNKDWLKLANALKDVLKIPLLSVLIPGLKSRFEPDNLLHASKIEDPRDIYLDEDGQNWRSVRAIFDRIQKKRTDVRVKFMTGLQDRLPTPRELLRIKNKAGYDLHEPVLTQHQGLWNYLMQVCAPVWSQSGTIDPDVPQLLLNIVETYNACQPSDNLEQTLRQSYAALTQYLSSGRAENVLHLYSCWIDVRGTRVRLLDFFMDCLQNTHDLSGSMQALATWVFRLSIDAHEKEPLPASRQQYFDINHLSPLLSGLPLKLQTGFMANVSRLEQRIAGKHVLTMEDFKAVLDLMTASQDDILHGSDELGTVIRSEFSSFWHYLVHRFAPVWQRSGRLPGAILHDLLNLIDHYYLTIGNEDALMQRMRAITSFMEQLKNHAIEDVNCFYGAVVGEPGCKRYVLEVLIDCLRDENAVSQNIPLLAEWLYRSNHSLVAKAPQLESLYERWQAGSFFDNAALHRSLLELSQKGLSAASKSILISLQESTARQGNRISEATRTNLTRLFAGRSADIRDTEDDYTRRTDGINGPWIALAQNLAGATLIAPNYYRLLYPALTHDIEPTDQEPVTSYPLTDFIVSDRGSLILLSASARYFMSCGTFANVSGDGVRLLTSREKWRISHAPDSHSVRCFDLGEKEQSNAGLSQMTVTVLKELVDRSIYPNGLLIGQDLSDNEQTILDEAYEQLFAYINGLPSAERHDLLQHRIRHNMIVHTFEEVLDLILHQRKCAASYGKFFIQLILNYNPLATFSPEVERLAQVPLMRLHIQKKSCRDPELSSQREASTRLLTLTHSLFTHHFSYFYNGREINLNQLTNNVTSSGYGMYRLIAPFLHKPAAFDANMVYQRIRTEIVDAALSKSRSIRSADTTAWLLKIEKGILFSPHNREDRDPGFVLQALTEKERNALLLRLQPENEPEESQLRATSAIATDLCFYEPGFFRKRNEPGHVTMEDEVLDASTSEQSWVSVLSS